MAADVGHGNKGRGRIHTLCYIAAENALKPRQPWSSVQDSPFPHPHPPQYLHNWDLRAVG